MAKPIVKWLGGKKRMIPHIIDLIPSNYQTWYEPFIGGGSLLFHFDPARAFIADKHPDLINMYRYLRESPREFISLVEQIEKEHSAERYYQVRDAFNACSEMTMLRTVQFLYLNCKCYNGLCRYNQKGGFNAPLHKIGHTTRRLPNANELMDVSRFLQKTEIHLGDFRAIPFSPGPEDFVIFDPPYLPYWEQGFTSYGVFSFGEPEHYDLCRCFHFLGRQGIRAMLWNSDTPKARQMYNGYPMFSIGIKNCVGQKSYGGRKKIRRELCILNYDPGAKKIVANKGEDSYITFRGQVEDDPTE